MPGQEIADAIERQRKVREAMKAESERLAAERGAAPAKNPDDTPPPPPLGGKVEP